MVVFVCAPNRLKLPPDQAFPTPYVKIKKFEAKAHDLG